MQARIAQKEETIIRILILKLSCSCAGPYCPEGGDDHKNINIKIKLLLCRPVLPRRRRRSPSTRSCWSRRATRCRTWTSSTSRSCAPCSRRCTWTTTRHSASLNRPPSSSWPGRQPWRHHLLNRCVGVGGCVWVCVCVCACVWVYC